MTSAKWWVGSNGNWFCDMAEARYCVAMITPHQYETARNGIVFGNRADSVATAKASCEDHADQWTL
jgi:hypothetical protein